MHTKNSQFIDTSHGCILQVKRESVSCSIVSDSETLWTVVNQAPLSMEFSRQEYQSG